ncbi:histidine triad nucleotide-binding protein [Candidatus Falkowbacteria bacterium]|nr:histidine triad nucleotide-binding protein [Candidatus Falkowbacteria bacterium]
MTECIFCKIINRQLPATLAYEDGEAVAFADIHPKAPVHLLIVPKQHIASLADVSESDGGLLARLLLIVQRLAVEQGISQRGYKTVINTGADGGQVVDHLHIHLLGGAHLSD